MLDKSGIYSITSPSGKMYVGSAALIKRRWSLHVHQLRAGTHHNKPLLSAFQKYSEENITFKVLLLCEKKDLLMYEQRLLDAWKPEYNICKTAGSILGMKQSAETRAKKSALMKGKPGRPASAETKAKMSAARKGRKHSPEWAEKIGASQRGKKLTPEAIAKRTETRKRNGVSPEARARMTAGVQAYFAEKRIQKNKTQMTLDLQ